MAAGFLYKRRSKFGKEYKCIGRVCLFAITKNGLYAESIIERDVVERLMELGKSCGGQFLYHDTEDTLMDGIFRLPTLNKEGYIYLYHKPKQPQIPYLFCENASPEKEMIGEFIEELKT